MPHNSTSFAVFEIHVWSDWFFGCSHFRIKTIFTESLLHQNNTVFLQFSEPLSTALMTSFQPLLHRYMCNYTRFLSNLCVRGRKTRSAAVSTFPLRLTRLRRAPCTADVTCQQLWRFNSEHRDVDTAAAADVIEWLMSAHLYITSATRTAAESQRRRRQLDRRLNRTSAHLQCIMPTVRAESSPLCSLP